MPQSDDFKRIATAGEGQYHRPLSTADYRAMGITNYNQECVYHEIKAMLDVSDPMVKAMLEVEWPEGMSASDQMKALFRAGIGAILEGLVEPETITEPEE